MAHIVPEHGIGGVEVAAQSMQAGVPAHCEFRLFWLRDKGASHRALHPAAQMRVVRDILHFQPDVLVCSLWRSVPVALACKLRHPRMKLVQFLHAERATHFVDRALTAIGMRAADAIWADSVATLQRRAPPGKREQRVISFVTDRLTPNAEIVPVGARLVSWSRLAHQKGIDRAIDLVRLLRCRGVDVHFDIWGPDGGELAALSARVAMHGLEAHVRFPGPLDRSQLDRVASDATFFLQLSRFEGMGMAVVEAMQLGLVPVVTPVGEIGSYVRDGYNGVVVDPARLAMAADTLQALLASTAQVVAMRGRAIDHWRSRPLYADDVCAAAQALNGETD